MTKYCVTNKWKETITPTPCWSVQTNNKNPFPSCTNLSIVANSFRLTAHQIPIVHKENALTSLPRPLLQRWPSQPQISLYLHDCLTHRPPPTHTHSLTAAHFNSLLISKNDWSKASSRRNHFDIITSKCQTDCDHCVGHDRYMLHVDDRLPFCCKFTNAKGMGNWSTCSWLALNRAPPRTW